MDLKFGHKIFFLFLLCAIGVIKCASVTGAEDKLHDRVVHGQKLSEKEHFEHDGDGDDVHDPDYDHEAFLGRDEAHEFDQLTPGKCNIVVTFSGFVTNVLVKHCF